MLQQIQGLQQKEYLSYVCNIEFHIGKHDRHERWLTGYNMTSRHPLSFPWSPNAHRRERTRRNAIAHIKYFLDLAALLH